MAKLKIERGVGEGTAHFIDAEATIGQDAAQVAIRLADPNVSRVHARIYKKEGSYYLEDLQSKNGTFLNGRPIAKKEALEPGDYIRVGLTWLCFGEDLELEKIRKELSAYEILEEISQPGSPGLCFKVQQVGLDRIVTLILLPPSIVRANPKLAQRFRQQACDLARMSHENLAIMLDFEATSSYLYLTTEYVEGEPLYTLLSRKKKLPVIKGLEIGIAVARALAHAHAHNVIHQDINPRNVFLCGRRVILAGFGVAAVLSDVQDQYSGLVNKIEYLSPEQLTKKKLDSRCDIYSLGVLLYELFAGKPPFGGDTPEKVANGHLNNTPEAITAFNPDLPSEIEHIIYQCLEKEPEQRPKSCEEVANKLDQILTRQQILALRKAPAVFTSPAAHYLMTLLSQPLLVWAVLPLLGVILSLLFSIIVLGKQL